MPNNNIEKITEDLKNKFPDLGIKKIELGDNGSASFYMQPTRELPFFKEPDKAVSLRKAVASTIRRNALDKTSIDIGQKTSVFDSDPKELFSLAMRYYKENPIVGSTVNLLVFLVTKGFENDIDDDDIKKFFDVWCYDINFQEVISWIVTDLIKVSHVFVYKNTAPYVKRESKISPVPGVALGVTSNSSTASELKDKIIADILREFAVVDKNVLNYIEKSASKKVKKATEIPVAYTVLNPTTVSIEGSMFLNSTYVVMEAPEDLKTLLGKKQSELTATEKEVVKSLSNDFKKQVTAEGKVTLDQDAVSQITYMKQPYERYATPRIARAFESLAYKQALVNADLSTLDGISNYILKVTVGNDDFPADQAQLEAVAKLFNTQSKSFDVVWNHTLEVEKIVSPEIGDILGKDKYAQVESDISAGMAVIRALIDGRTEGMNGNQLGLLLKGLSEEITYIRAIVSRWIYKEYTQIAEVVGFDRFPKVRWDDSILKDTILYMTIMSQLVDRRMLSYRTAHEALGFDYSNELNNMQKEMPLVQDGTFGLRGSPWQQSKDIQPTQEAPKGTPSNGRPKAQPTKKKKSPDGSDAVASLFRVENMSESDLTALASALDKIRNREINIDVE